MTVRLEPEQRSFLTDVRKRARTLDQHYAARALLMLDAGVPVAAVARKLGVASTKIAKWSNRFHEYGIEYIVAMGRSRRRVRSSRPGSPSYRAAAKTGDEEELMRQIQANAPRMSDLIRMAQEPSASGADVDADPADLFKIS